MSRSNRPVTVAAVFGSDVVAFLAGVAALWSGVTWATLLPACGTAIAIAAAVASFMDWRIGAAAVVGYIASLPGRARNPQPPVQWTPAPRREPLIDQIRELLEESDSK